MWDANQRAHLLPLPRCQELLRLCPGWPSAEIHAPVRACVHGMHTHARTHIHACKHPAQPHDLWQLSACQVFCLFWKTLGSSPTTILASPSSHPHSPCSTFPTALADDMRLPIIWKVLPPVRELPRAAPSTGRCNPGQNSMNGGS